MSGPINFLIDGAHADSIVPLLHPTGVAIRLYGHLPTPEIRWWRASVPLTCGGVNRTVCVQNLSYDLEISRVEFIEWIDEFKQGGLTLVQSRSVLPDGIHPHSFRDVQRFEAVLNKLGAMLFFELPHANETAGLTVFSDDHAEWIKAQGAPLRLPG